MTKDSKKEAGKESDSAKTCLSSDEPENSNAIQINAVNVTSQVNEIESNNKNQNYSSLTEETKGGGSTNDVRQVCDRKFNQPLIYTTSDPIQNMYTIDGCSGHLTDCISSGKIQITEDKSLARDSKNSKSAVTGERSIMDLNRTENLTLLEDSIHCSTSGAVDLIESSEQESTKTSQEQSNIESNKIISIQNPSNLPGFSSRSDVISQTNSETEVNKASMTVAGYAVNPKMSRKQRKLFLAKERILQNKNKEKHGKQQTHCFNVAVIPKQQNKSNIEDECKPMSKTAKTSIMETATTGLQKYLQVINILTKNPEKCQTWLKNQDQQKQKLGDKYKEPIIYSTVKRFASRYGPRDLSETDKSIPEITNSLELLNVLYLQPEKCKDWLKMQLDLKNKLLDKYEEPLIYHTVKLIDLHHSKEKNGNKEDKTINIKKDYAIDVKTRKMNNKLFLYKRRHEKNKISGQVGILDVMNIDDKDKKTNESKLTSFSTKENVIKYDDTTSKNENGLIYVILSPLTKHQNVKMVLENQKQLKSIMGDKYKVPKFNAFGKVLPFNLNFTSKWVVRIPLKTKITNIKYKIDLPETLAIEWLESQIRSHERFSDKYIPQKCNKVYSVDQPKKYNPEKRSTVQLLPDNSPSNVSSEEYVNNYIQTENICYNQPTGFNEGSYYPPPMGFFYSVSQTGYCGQIQPALNYQTPPFFNQPNTVNLYCSPEHNLAPPGIGPPVEFPHNFHEPSSSVQISIESTDFPNSATVKGNGTCTKEPDLYSDIPSTPNIEVSNSIMEISQNTPNFSKIFENPCTSKKADSLTNEPIDKTNTGDFNTENCTGNLAFRYKGKDIYYPLNIKEKNRIRWVNRQLRLYTKKGDLYVPPDFGRDGKLAPKKIEQITSTEVKIINSKEVQPSQINEDIALEKTVPLSTTFKMSVQSKPITQRRDVQMLKINKHFIEHMEHKNSSEEHEKVVQLRQVIEENKQKPSLDDMFLNTTLQKITKLPEQSSDSRKSDKNIYATSVHMAYQNTNIVKSSANTIPDVVSKQPSAIIPLSQVAPMEHVPMYTATGFTPGLSTQPELTTQVRVVEAERTLGKSKVSAFERLGPPTEAKKPKLTINLMFAKDDKLNVVREVIKADVPVYLRKNVIDSEDVIVKEYLRMWPWARTVHVLKESTNASKDIFLDEIEMSAYYSSESAWIKVVVTGYPLHFKKEDVLDMLLSYVKTRKFIPCFIEFNQENCTFLLNKSEDALTYLHSNGLIVNKDDVKLDLKICLTNLSMDNLKFSKGTVFKTILQNNYDEQARSLDLSTFQLKPDNSHFMYFPLNILHNQIFIMNVVRAILPSRNITTLNLSGNRLTNISSFNLSEYLPSLRILDLNNNLLPNVSTLACFKGIPMYSLSLEGNPLCHNFIQRDHYIDVVKLIFPRLIILDGVHVGSEIEIKKNFSINAGAVDFVNMFLEIFFTLTDSNDRMQMEPLYSENAVFSITCQPEMKTKYIYDNLKVFYMRCRLLKNRSYTLENLEGAIVGGLKIVRYFTRWPMMAHDPHSFTVDVMQHTETVTILKVTGLFKIPAADLTQDEPVLEFSRTFVLVTEDGVEYKICNDLMYISEATADRIRSSFQTVELQTKSIDILSMKLQDPPDDYLKDKLAEIIMRLTSMESEPSRRCLEIANWDLRKSLENFIYLEKIDAMGKSYS